MKPLLILALISLTGCATSEQIQARRESEAEQHRERQIAYSQGLKAQCESIGYRADTDPWRECVLRLHQQAQANNAALQNMVIQQYMQNQPRQTTCGKDYLGRVQCVSR